MVRICRKLDSETLHLPELKPLIGRTVDITVEEHAPGVHDVLWTEATRLPETEGAFSAQKVLFDTWRSDPRFSPYWSVLDSLADRTFDQVRQWATIQALLPLRDYDYDALRAHDACDMEEARRRSS